MMTLFVQGCVSVQLPGWDGRPELFGFGSTTSIGGTNGQVYQITAPGLSVRLGSAAPGISLGWHQTSLFYPATTSGNHSSPQPVAIQTKCLGIDLALFYIMAGSENTFAVPLPERESSIVQYIAYSEKYPNQTVVERKESK